MAQIFKITEQVQLKSSAQKFYDFLRNKMEFVIQMFPDIYQSCEVLEGNGISHGSIIHLKYNLGSPAQVKERIYIDDDNKLLTFECLEGDIFKEFNMIQLKIQVLENDSNGSSVEWSLEFVKANEDVATPHHYLLFANKVSKGLDDYLCMQQLI